MHVDLGVRVRVRVWGWAVAGDGGEVGAVERADK